MTRTLFVAGTLIVLTGIGALAVRHPSEPRFATATVTRGDLVRSVLATGSLGALQTVKVGSQVSGTISEVLADYNSLVHRGQVLARLEPTAAREAVEQARAKVLSAQDDVEAADIMRADAAFKLDEADKLNQKAILTQADLEDAQVTWKQAMIDLSTKRAALAEAQAELNQAETDLGHTVITSPVDGIVVARDVDAGQTLAARMDAPTLFDIATDISGMQIDATIDEADIGLVKIGQTVTFWVGAYPSRQYTGTIREVRVGPDQPISSTTASAASVTASAVVSYTAVIDVPNPDLSLRPGMTATLTVEVARRPDTLEVTRAAMDFVPSPEVFAALRQAVPEELAPAAASRGTSIPGTVRYVWRRDANGIYPVKVTTGLSDGANVEISSPGIEAGAAVLTGVSLRR